MDGKVMKIGIVGLGVVGSAVKFGLERLGHDIFVHDIKLDTKINDVIGTEICYICVPTPPCQDGSCDVSIVKSVVEELIENSYTGLICIRSTVNPGTTENMLSLYPRICFVPEFLRERCAISDFIENHEVCIIGTHSKDEFDLIKQSHGSYPSSFAMCSPTEAELAKYFSNTYNAMQITFANSFYEICERLNASYDRVKDSLKARKTINFEYLECNKNYRGFGGVCLPKDTSAIDALCKRLNIKVNLFECILEENAKYTMTVPDGMRN